MEEGAVVYSKTQAPEWTFNYDKQLPFANGSFWGGLPSTSLFDFSSIVVDIFILSPTQVCLLPVLPTRPTATLGKCARGLHYFFTCIWQLLAVLGIAL